MKITPLFKHILRALNHPQANEKMNDINVNGKVIVVGK
jgi:hypothetical protein